MCTIAVSKYPLSVSSMFCGDDLFSDAFCWCRQLCVRRAKSTHFAIRLDGRSSAKNDACSNEIWASSPMTSMFFNLFIYECDSECWMYCNCSVRRFRLQHNSEWQKFSPQFAYNIKVPLQKKVHRLKQKKQLSPVEWCTTIHPLTHSSINCAFHAGTGFKRPQNTLCLSSKWNNTYIFPSRARDAIAYFLLFTWLKLNFGLVAVQMCIWAQSGGQYVWCVCVRMSVAAQTWSDRNSWQ